MKNYNFTKLDKNASVISFADLENAAKLGNPEKFHNENWMSCGPFVLKTEGTFETEYLYDRDKILDYDYFSLCGGENNVEPIFGDRIPNPVLGNKDIRWKEGFIKWGELRFESDNIEDACDDALYLTPQRNCVFYAAVYVHCSSKSRAVICYENSGCKLFVNGELVSKSPFGRIKGLETMGNTVPVTFVEGLNLLLFKIRPGYICDAIDLSMKNCSIYPVCVENNDVIVTYPTKTNAYIDNKYQVFPLFVSTFSDVPSVKVMLDDDEYDIGELKAGECKMLRAKIDTTYEEVQVKCSILCFDKVKSSTFVSRTMPVVAAVRNALTASFHFDTTYHQEQGIYSMGAMYILREMLEKMRKNPEFKVVISEVDYIHPFYSLYPKDREFLLKMFKDGRAEADCFYNQPNELTSSPEGIVRNLVYGQFYHKDVMGRKCYVYNPCDVFGHFNQMSQLCNKGGCEGIAWGKAILGFVPAFKHISPDGTSLLHRRGSVSNEYAKKIGLSICDASKSLISTVPAYPVDEDMAWLEGANTEYAVHSFINKRMLEDIENGARVSYSSRDMSLYHAGVALTRTDFKQANRFGENSLITAEKLCVIAGLYGYEYPELLLDKSWRQLLCGQHHDSITGTNNEVSFIDLMIEYREVFEISKKMINGAMAIISSLVKTKKDDAIVIFNSHAFDRTEPCFIKRNNIKIIDALGNEIPSVSKKDGSTLFLAQTPSFGYSTYFLEQCEDAIKVITITEYGIENDFYRIRTDASRGGGIISLFDKEENKELIPKKSVIPANCIISLKETHNRMEPQHEFYTTGHRLDSSTYEACIQKEVSDVYEKLIIKYILGNVVYVTQEITLWKSKKRIDFETTLGDYRDENDLFVVAFPMDIKGVKPIFDDRFAPQVRTTSKEAFSFQTHQYAMASHCAVYAANQWMDYGPSVTFVLKDEQRTGSINIGMSQVICNENLISVSDDLMMGLTKKAIPVSHFLDTVQDFDGTSIIHFNEDLEADTRFVLLTENHKNDYANELLDEIKMEKLKQNGILHLQTNDNIWKKLIDVIFIYGKDINCLQNIVHELNKQLAIGRIIEINCIMPETVPTSEDYGVSLINKGNLACSVEKGGILQMMLFHTAEFYGNIGNTHNGSRFVPEHKSHTFSYALYPHKESYREAKIYNEALAFNDPLIISDCLKSNSNGFLPLQKSYLGIEGNVVVTAIKAGGYPLASLKSEMPSFSQRGIAIRYFEPNGISANTKFNLHLPLSKVSKTDLLEENEQAISINENCFSLETTTHSIETVRIYTSEEKTESKKFTSIGIEPITPVYLRSWEYNMGSMPTGYLGICATIDRKTQVISSSQLKLSLNFVNNYTDKEVTIKSKLLLPKGWSVDKVDFENTILPSGFKIVEVILNKPESDGIIYLQTNYNGILFEDLLEFGYFDPEIMTEFIDNEIVVTIKNSTSQPMHGGLMIASSFETWEYMSDWRKNINVLPNSTSVYRFCADVHGLSTWFTAKLTVNGRVFFSGTNNRPSKPHVLYAHEFIKDLEADGGSIRKLLEMSSMGRI